MKRGEIIYREMLYQAMEKKNRVLTQSSLSKDLQISLSMVHKALSPLRNMGAIEVHQRNFHVIDIKKILYYWASVRNIKKDVLYATRTNLPVKEIERLMPDTINFGAYSAYKLTFDDVPADYSEVYVYGTEELKERFPEQKGIPNLFVLHQDPLQKKYGKMTTLAQTFVDLWNLKEWYAKEFVNALEKKLNAILE